MFRQCKISIWIGAAWGLTAAAGLAGPYSPLPGQPGCTAISATSSSIVEWASGATIVRGLRSIENPTEYSPDPNSPLNYAFYGGSDGACAAASAASVAAAGNPIATTANTAPIGAPPQPQPTYYAVALGQNGTATLTFDQPITNGPGPDFAVFNNGFSNGTTEWCKPGLVSVSSDGVNFFSFPSVSLTQTTTQVGSSAELDPTDLYDIAGNFPAGWGTPFDLSELAGVSPLLNVNAVTEVRITSVTGDINPAYATFDSQGNIINAPWPAAATAGSEGFCLAGVGVVNALPVWTWTHGSGTSASWSNGTNWSPATVPSSGTATFAGARITVTLDGNQSAGALVFNVAGTDGYTLSQGTGGALTLGTSVGATIAVLSGAHAISAPIVLAGNLVVSMSGGGSLDLSGSVSQATGVFASLSLSGEGQLILSGTDSYTGDTTVSSGTLCVTDSSALPEETSLTIGAGGVFIFDPSVADAQPLAALPAEVAANSAAAVPEPAMFELLAAGGACFLAARFRSITLALKLINRNPKRKRERLAYASGYYEVLSWRGNKRLPCRK
jgi:autotransporter-associated beta strand protein